MGCSASIKVNNQQNMNSEQTHEHESGNKNRTNRKQTVLEYFEDVINSCIEFFQPIDVSDVQTWGTEDGRKIAEKMFCLKYQNERLEQEERQTITELCIQKQIPQLYHKYLKHVNDNLQIIFTKNKAALQDESDNIDKTALQHAQHIIGSMVVHFVNASDVSRSVVQTFINLGIMKTVLCILELYYPVINEYNEDIHYQKVKQKNKLRIASHALSLTHNASKHLPRLMLSQGTVEKILPFLQSKIKLLSMKSLLTLSYLITEENNEKIVGSKEPMNLLLHYIRSAIKSESHRFVGFNLSELLTGLAKLAQNDQNKKTLVEIGTIEVIALVFGFVKEGEEESDEELLQACNVLYQLSFIQENREKITQETIIVDSIKKLNESKNPKILKAIRGVHWELMEKRKRNKPCDETSPTQDVSISQQQLTEEKQEIAQQHIMISYQWDHQESMLKVRNKLQEEGYKVWIDLDEMGGSTLEAMAGAVENAALLLITVSRKYKDSSNCRSEAEYAFQLKRTIIPLMMEVNYNADGWLGFIVGAKYWIDFIDGRQIDTSLESLMKEVKKQIIPSPSEYVAVEEKPKRENTKNINDVIKEWSNDHATKWIRSIGLFDVMGTDVMQDLNGKTLVRLHRLKEESIDTFFRLLKENLRLNSLLHLFKFEEELQALFTAQDRFL